MRQEEGGTHNTDIGGLIAGQTPGVLRGGFGNWVKDYIEKERRKNLF